MRTQFVVLVLAAASVVGCNPFGRGRVDRATGLPIADVPESGSRWLSPAEVMQQARDYQSQGHQGQHGGECPHCAQVSAAKTSSAPSSTPPSRAASAAAAVNAAVGGDDAAASTATEARGTTSTR
jgi:hypothetical protein